MKIIFIIDGLNRKINNEIIKQSNVFADEEKRVKTEHNKKVPQGSQEVEGNRF